jgi:sulfoxide reductase heme-binding subunit YedZ
MRRWLRPALWVLVIVPVPVIVAFFFLGKLGANPIREVEHMTGEWALRFLAASLAVTPLMRITGAGWLVAERRFLGLAAFFWALGHLLVYTVLDWFFDWHEIWKDILKHWYVTLGMLAFLLLIPLALTSTKASIRRLGGKRWTRLHQLVYVSVAAACLHFFWAVKKDRSEPILYASVVAALLASRLVWRGGRRPSVRSGPGSAATEPTG